MSTILSEQFYADRAYFRKLRQTAIGHDMKAFYDDMLRRLGDYQEQVLTAGYDHLYETPQKENH